MLEKLEQFGPINWQSVAEQGAMGGHLDMIKLATSKDRDACRYADGYLCASIQKSKGKIDILKYVVEHMPSPLARDYLDPTLACAKSYHYNEIVAFLEELLMLRIDY